jgi:hypothetical protein
MRQVRITTQHRTADARRRPKPVLPLDPRDPDLLRANKLQHQRRYPYTPAPSFSSPDPAQGSSP